LATQLSIYNKKPLLSAPAAKQVCILYHEKSIYSHKIFGYDELLPEQKQLLIINLE